MCFSMYQKETDRQKCSIIIETMPKVIKQILFIKFIFFNTVSNIYIVIDCVKAQIHHGIRLRSEFFKFLDLRMTPNLHLLKAAKILEDAGFTSEQAQIIAESMQEAIENIYRFSSQQRCSATELPVVSLENGENYLLDQTQLNKLEGQIESLSRNIKDLSSNHMQDRIYFLLVAALGFVFVIFSHI